MSHLKTTLRVGGIVVAAAGALFLPVRSHVFNKADLSAFHNWAAVGVFASAGVILIVVGLVAFAVSFLIRGDLTD